jgi:hypothetical protein
MGQSAAMVAWGHPALAVAYDKTFMIYELVAPD